MVEAKLGSRPGAWPKSSDEPAYSVFGLALAEQLHYLASKTPHERRGVTRVA